jgi:hypothetical protein
LTGKEAEQALVRLGQLRWTFTQQEVIALPAAPVLVPTVDSFYPRRTGRVLEQGQMRSWPGLHRLVFALADGTKSVMKIAEALSTPPDLVDRALRDLQSIGVIAMEPYNKPTKKL